MAVTFNDLLEGAGLSNDARVAVQEAWESRLAEAREELTAELREEFAQRYEHDKGLIVEAVESFINKKVEAEVAELAEDKKALAEERVKYRKAVSEHAKLLDKFVTEMVAKEVKELRADRTRVAEHVSKLDNFVAEQLAEELKEFHEDKKALVEQKVKMVREGKRQLAEAKKDFISKAAGKIESTINRVISEEVKSFRNDITAARENDFGRRIFEAFASEFAVTHLSENKEFAKLKAELETKDQVIAESQKAIAEKEALVESKNREVKVITESITRKEKLAELFKPLNKEKADVMSSLLEGVQTERLQAAYEKYLPAVLNNSSVKKAEKPVLAESRTEVTGDKSAKDDADANNNVIEIRRLAGLK